MEPQLQQYDKYWINKLFEISPVDNEFNILLSWWWLIKYIL
jgi:hypothetical protein